MAAKNENKTFSRVTGSQRHDFMARKFKKFSVMAEGYIFQIASAHSKNYRGGSWDFFESIDGSFYMAPQTPSEFDVCVNSNFFEGKMSSDAYGIVITLYALNYLAMDAIDSPLGDYFSDQYHDLRNYALNHSEASKIMGAID